MKFIFVWKSSGSTAEPRRRLLKDSASAKAIDTGADNVLAIASAADPRFLFTDGNFLGFLRGYVRFPSLPPNTDVKAHNRLLFDDLLRERFPLEDNVANSFGALAYSGKESLAVIANDVLGFYPIYYFVGASLLVISSHLRWAQLVLNTEIDHTGVVQRLTGGEFCNFGRRTILRGVSRLLPGEFLKFDLTSGIRVTRKYDNGLYSGNWNSDIKEAAEELWDVIRAESRLCFSYDTDVNLGMSGGMDSRLLLASVPTEKNLTCFTYGSPNYYETKIAERCATAVNARFRSFPVAGNLFPRKEVLEKYVRETEAVGINPWFSVLEQELEDHGEPPFALGDFCEAIPGRNIKAYSSRNARIKTYLGLARIKWTPLNSENLERWKRDNTASILAKLDHASKFYVDLDRDKMRSETASDIDELYARIESHDVKYVELLDEIFAWYVHARIPSSNQLLLIGAKFTPVCPTMSARCLRAASRIHPALRLNARLMDAIFRLPDLRKLATIPTAQIPFVKYNQSQAVKLLMWGARSKVDQLMIKAASARKKADARNRLLKSINWALEYQQADPDVVLSWFRPDHVGADRFIEMFEGRRGQSAHPLTPFDIASAAALNIEIDLLTSPPV